MAGGMVLGYILFCDITCPTNEHELTPNTSINFELR